MKRTTTPPQPGTSGPRRPALPVRLVRTYRNTGRSLSEPDHRNPEIGGAELAVGPRHFHAALVEDAHGRPWTRVTALTRPGVWGRVPEEALPAMHRLMLYAFAEDLGSGQGVSA